MIYHYPLGVGMGNWQVYSNKIKPYHLVNANIFILTIYFWKFLMNMVLSHLYCFYF